MEIELYVAESGKSVVTDFLESLPPKDMAKVMRDIELLAKYGRKLGEPYTKHVEGPIWELRSKFSSNIYRIFYFICSEDKLVLLHGFTKKTQKTPKPELMLLKKE